MCFVFTSTPDNATTANMNAGLEIARMIPDVGGNEGYFGVGDWFTAGASPTERLHLLDGRLRIQELPDDPAAVDSFYVMVVDRTLNTATNQERGVVKWVPPSQIGAGDCDWVVQPSPFGPHVSSVYNGATCDWNMKYGVGIGVQVPKMKLQVMHTDDAILDHIAISGSSRFTLDDGVEVFGVIGEARTATQDISSMQAFGVLGDAEGAKYATGVEGRARMDSFTSGSGARAVGVSGIAAASGNMDVCIGVLGRAGGSSLGLDWAMFSLGSQFSTTSGTWATSDESLKTEIEDMSGGLETIMQLSPKTYMFRTEEYPNLHLSTELQNGMIAQEMQEVVPNLVRNVKIPAELDSLGNEVSPVLDVLAVKYEGLIPLLISAVQEQQALITSLQDQINNCCAAPGGMAPENGDHGAAPTDGMLQEQRLLIIPNPVADLTRLEYYVPQAGKVSLQVSNSDGKILATLREEMAQEGAHNYSWNTTDLAAGTYFCTYMLDGAVVVKRAVKVK